MLRQSKGLTGGAEVLPIPAPVVFGFRFSSDADFYSSAVSFRHW